MLRRLFDMFDSLAELPRIGRVWRPASIMGPVEYGIKLLLGFMIVALSVLAAILAVAGTLLVVFILVVAFPYTALVIAFVVGLAIGIGYTQKSIDRKRK